MPSRPTKKLVNLEDPKEAARLLEEDARLGVELDSGGKLAKRLSPSVRKVLQQIANGGSISDNSRAKNLSQLAKALGVSRVTLYEYRDKWGVIPGKAANGSYDVVKVKEWVASKKGETGEPPANSGGHAPNRNQQLKIRLQEIAVEEKEFELGKRRGDYRTTDEINRHIDTANGVVMRELEKVFVHELPPILEGMSAAEIQVAIRDNLAVVLKSLPKALKKELSK